LDARTALIAIAGGDTLSRADARSAMASVMSGEATPAQLGALLAAMHVRGETVDEIAGFATALRDAAVHVDAPGGAIDTCGTGGDRSNTFNISTVAAIVAACDAADVPHPDIITESGRAMVAYHSALIFDVVGATTFRFGERLDDDYVMARPLPAAATAPSA